MRPRSRLRPSQDLRAVIGWCLRMYINLLGSHFSLIRINNQLSSWIKSARSSLLILFLNWISSVNIVHSVRRFLHLDDQFTWQLNWKSKRTFIISALRFHSVIISHQSWISISFFIIIQFWIFISPVGSILFSFGFKSTQSFIISALTFQLV